MMVSAEDFAGKQIKPIADVQYVDMRENVFRDQEDVYALMEAFGGAMGVLALNPGSGAHPEDLTMQAISKLAQILGVNTFCIVKDGKAQGYGRLMVHQNG
jgi:hypothetical protein